MFISLAKMKDHANAGVPAEIDGIETNRGGEGFWIRGLSVKEALHPFNPKRLPVPLPRR